MMWDVKNAFLARSSGKPIESPSNADKEDALLVIKLRERYRRRDEYVRKQCVIDDDLYDLLLGYYKAYKVELSDVLTCCIEVMQEQFTTTMRLQPRSDRSSLHTFFMPLETAAALERMRKCFGVSISRLVNTAVAFACKSRNEQDD